MYVGFRYQLNIFAGIHRATPPLPDGGGSKWGEV